jgi:SNF2 family DNA or RNA helicase
MADDFDIPASMAPPAASQVRIWVDKRRIRVQAPYGFADNCRAIPGGRWYGQRDTPQRAQWHWHYPATPEVAGRVLEEFGSTPVQATRDFIELAGRAKQAEEARRLKSRDDLPAVPGERVASWLHQLQAHHFAKGQDAVMLAVGMGGGKSKIAVDLLEAGWPDMHRVLILCPNNVVKVWPKEFKGALEDDVLKGGHQHRHWRIENGLRPNRNGRLVSGSLRERARLFEDTLKLASPQTPVAIVVNYEAAPQADLGDWIRSQQWDCVVLDESHRVKSPGGVQSRFCEGLRDKARKRLCLTGTMMPHSPLDVYAQYRFLDPGVFGTNYSRFRQRYAVMGGYQGKQVLGMNEEALPDLYAKIARLAYIITNEELDEVLGLEEPLWPNTIYADLEPKARKAYDGLRDDLIAGIGEGVVTVNNALTQLLRLQQITSGWLPVQRPCPRCEGDEECPVCKGEGYLEELTQVGDEKVKAFADWLTDLPIREPVVVACRFTADLDSIRAVAEKQGRRYGELSGRRNDGLTEYATMSPDCDVVGVQIQAGGVGIDFTRAHYVANFSVGFSLGDFEQWLKRTHRPGQKHRVTYQNFACTNTVDVAVFRLLHERKEVVGGVIRGAKEAGEL